MDSPYGAIVAAGRGKRIGPINYEYPKALLPVANKPIIVHQIQSMRSIGITEVFIVVGHLREKIERHLGDGRSLGVRIHYVLQETPHGIGHAVLQLEEHIDKPFLLCLGDIFFMSRDLALFLDVMRDRDAHALLAVVQDEPKNIRRNFCVVLDTDGSVARVIEKPQHPTTDLKGCGIYLLKPSVFDAIRRTPRSSIRHEYELTDAIQTLVDDGNSVRAVEAIQWDVNITDLCDLLRANLQWLAHSGKKYLLGKNAQINPDARVVDSVVGDEVVIANAVTVERSILLPGVHYEGRADLVCSVLYSNGQIDCNRNKARAMEFTATT